MSDIPKMRHRDMTARLGEVVSTHQQISQGIRERAEAMQKAHDTRNLELNAGSRLVGKTK